MPSVQNQIETRLRAMLIKHLQGQLPKIEAVCKQLLDSAIKLSSTYQSLRQPTGQLRQELGIEHPQVIDQLMQIWVDSLRATLIVRPKSLIVEVKAVSEYSDLIKVAFHPLASYRTEKGAMIEFMRWLLFVGTQPVIEDHYVKRANPYEMQFSRTDSLIMREKRGAFYSVPPQYAGTIDNNFIVKVCQDIQSEIFTAIRKAIQ